MSDGPQYVSNESPIVEPIHVAPAAQVAVPVAAVDQYDARVMQVGQPVVAEQVVAAPAVAAQVVGAPAAVRTSYTRSFAPDAIVAAIVGLVVLLVGLLAITRAGFDGPMETPVVSVLGFTHTTLLGLIEIVIGGCLLISGATRSRSAALFFGAVLGIAAFVGALQTKSFEKNLALESGLAWLLLFAAVIVVLTALLLPRYLKRSTVVRSA